MELKDVLRTVVQYRTLNNESQVIQKRLKELKEPIVEAVKELGEEDSKGHLILDFGSNATDVGAVVYQRRVSKSLDQDRAEELLKERGLFDKCVVMVPTLDEEAVMAAYYDGSLTEADIDEMFPSKVTWALTFHTKDPE